MKTFPKVLAFVVPFCLAAPALSGNATGTVQFEWGQYASSQNFPGYTFFYVQGGTPKTGTPACAANFSQRWVINNSWPAAKIQISTLLAAALSGKKVFVYGSNDCAVWGDTETAVDVHIIN
ncbi:MAG: hypothetical protein ACK5TK_07490 [Betaproteobacteria bacterium]